MIHPLIRGVLTPGIVETIVSPSRKTLFGSGMLGLLDHAENRGELASVCELPKGNAAFCGILSAIADQADRP